MDKYLLFMIFSFLLCTERGKGDKAQKLLNTLDLEEIVEQLEEYDVDQDGQLSEMEVELQQPHIQKYLDRYAELLKAEEDDNDDEEDTDKKDSRTSQQTAQDKKTEAQNKKSDKQPETDSHTPKETQESNVQGARTKHQKDTVTPSSKTQKEPEARTRRTPDSTEIPAVEDEDDGVEIEVVEDLEFVEEDETQTYSKVTLSAFVVAAVAGILTLFFVLLSKAKAEQQVKRRQKEGQ